jgi:hypothetical protein
MRRNVKHQLGAERDAGLAFRRARQRPTSIDLTPWALLNFRDLFLRAYREGQRSPSPPAQTPHPFASEPRIDARSAGDA